MTMRRQRRHQRIANDIYDNHNNNDDDDSIANDIFDNHNNNDDDEHEDSDCNDDDATKDALLVGGSTSSSPEDNALM